MVGRVVSWGERCRPKRSCRAEWAEEEAGSEKPANWAGEMSVSSRVAALTRGISCCSTCRHTPHDTHSKWQNKVLARAVVC